MLIILKFRFSEFISKHNLFNANLCLFCMIAAAEFKYCLNKSFKTGRYLIIL